MPFRAFVAVEVGAQPPVEAFMDDLRATGADLKLVDPGNLHVTLKFLGDTPEARADDILEAMEGAVSGVAAGRLELVGAGAFPKPQNPRVVWVGVGAGGDALATIHEGLEKRLEPLGYAPERRDFHPHVTVARTRSPRHKGRLTTAIQNHRDADFGEVPLARVVLMRSDLRPHGPEYSVVEAAPLEA